MRRGAPPARATRSDPSSAASSVSRRRTPRRRAWPPSTRCPAWPAAPTSTRRARSSASCGTSTWPASTPWSRPAPTSWSGAWHSASPPTSPSSEPGGAVDLYEALMTTRSMRRLTDDPPVTDADIEHCLRAAAQAPSGGNVQPYHFVVITDPGARAAIAELYLRGWRRYRPAMVAGFPPFPTPEAEGSFRRSVELSEHLAEHLADTPSVLFCLAAYDNVLTDDEGALDVGTLHASIFPAVQSFMLAA